MATPHLIYFGTYTRSTSRGIYSAQLDDDTGALSTPRLVAETESPTWITFSPDRKFLYAVHASKAQAIGYTVDAVQGGLTPLPASALLAEKADSPAHLDIDPSGRVLIASNYGGGFVASMAVHPDGSLGVPTIIQHTGHGPNPQRQEKPHVHSAVVSPDGRFAIVCDLGLDRIFTYAIDAAQAKLTPGNPPFVSVQACTGPRHFKFGPDGRHGYCLTEMGSTVEVFDYDPANGSLHHIQQIVTLPPGYQAKWGAELRFHPNGRFLYVSNRGHDSITVFAVDGTSGKLTLVENVRTGGEVPRNFALSPNGKWLVCAHQESGHVTVFKVDSDTGRLTAVPSQAKVAMGVCVLFYN